MRHRRLDRMADQMSVTNEPLYRFLSRIECNVNDVSTVPGSVGAIKEGWVNFDWKSNTFQSEMVCPCVHGGLPLRKHYPGNPKFPVIIETVPPPETWEDVVYFLPTEFASGSFMEKVAHTRHRLVDSFVHQFCGHPGFSLPPAADAVKELCLFRCYELPAGTQLPDGFACVVDDFPVTGHATIHTTSPQPGECISICYRDYIYSEKLHSLPWRFVGYYLCPGAWPRRDLGHCSDERATGRMLLTMLCRHQDVYSLEQLESLRLLVAAPDYALTALAALLPPAATLDLLEAAMEDSDAIEELSRMGNLASLVRKLEEDTALTSSSLPSEIAHNAKDSCGSPTPSPPASAPSSPLSVV